MSVRSALLHCSVCGSSLATSFTASFDLVYCLDPVRVMPGFRVLFSSCTYTSIVSKQRVGVSGCSSTGVTLRRSRVSSCETLVHYRLIFGIDLSIEPELWRHISASDDLYGASRVSTLACQLLASELHFCDLNILMITYIWGSGI